MLCWDQVMVRFKSLWFKVCWSSEVYKNPKKSIKMSLIMIRFDEIYVVLLARGDVVAVRDRTLTPLSFPAFQWRCCVSCLETLNLNREKLELIYLHDCVADRSGGSNRYLNVTFYNRPTDRGRNNKTAVQERACDCLLSLFISLCKHRCLRENVWMQGYIFLSCHALLKLIAGVTPWQRARRQPELNNDNTFDETTS